MLHLPSLSPLVWRMSSLKSVSASLTLILGIALVPTNAIAQPLFVAQQIRPQDTNPEFDVPFPEPDITPLPPIEELLDSPDPDPLPDLGDESELQVMVNRVEFVGNTIFSDEELAEVIPEGIIGNLVTINRLYEIRSAVAQKYLDADYASSGAFLPEQPIQDGVITIQVVEGSLTTINIRGNEKLKDSYIANRIRRDIETPLNVDDLLDTLRRLQLDPRIATLSAELSGGVALGESILTVDVTEGDDFDVVLGLDNSRSPSVGSFRQSVDLDLLNVNGYGETFNLSLARTTGSTSLDGSITTFLDADNSTIQLRGGISSSEIIEEPFETLNLESEAFFTELAYRKPLVQTLTEELAVGVSLGHQQTRSVFDLADALGGPIPLTSFGANEEGEVRVSTLRFFQEWSKRRSRDVFAARSQFSVGLDALSSTVNNDGRPDSRFVSWRGQAQWAHLLAQDTLLLVKTDVQFADDDLLSLEQFGLGGQSTIRGYRQDILLTDNGFLASAEARFPIVKARKVDGVLHVIPFLDIGKGWNIGDDDPSPSALVGTGLALQWQQDDLTARIDIGLPLVDVDTRDDNSLQEMGIYMSLEWAAF